MDKVNNIMKFDTLIEAALNGLAKGKTLEDLAKKHNVDIKDLEKQLIMGAIGTKDENGVEIEHTAKDINNPTEEEIEAAKKIAMDHLVEDPEYYTKLKKIENSR